jgi:hypothetical protein
MSDELACLEDEINRLGIDFSLDDLKGEYLDE